MTTKYNLYSQRLDFKNQEWQEKGCAIASLLMIMDRLKPAGKRLPELNKLYQVGLNRRAYISGVGWRHTGLVGLAKIYGFKKSSAVDLAKAGDQEATLKLKQALKTGPVLASVYYKYQPGNGGHLVVLKSLSNNTAEVLDPDSQTRGGVEKTLPARKFLAGWKKRFIIVRL